MKQQLRQLKPDIKDFFGKIHLLDQAMDIAIRRFQVLNEDSINTTLGDMDISLASQSQLFYNLYEFTAAADLIFSSSKDLHDAFRSWCETYAKSAGFFGSIAVVSGRLAFSYY